MLLVLYKENKNFQLNIVKIFLSIIFNICFGAQRNRLIKTVLLNTHNICFGLEIRKLNFRYALLTKVLLMRLGMTSTVS